MSCDVGEALPHSTTVRRFTYVTARSPTVPLLHLRHRHFTYVTAHSPILPPFHLCHSSFYYPSVASPTSQALHVVIWRAAHAPVMMFNMFMMILLSAVTAARRIT